MDVARESSTMQDLESSQLHQYHKNKLSIDENDNSSICTDHSSATVKRSNLINESKTKSIKMPERVDKNAFNNIKLKVRRSSDEDIERALQNPESEPLFSIVLGILDANTSVEVARRDILRAIVAERFSMITKFLNSSNDLNIRDAIQDDMNGMPLLSTMPGVYESDDVKRSELFRAIAKYRQNLQDDMRLEVHTKESEIRDKNQRNDELKLDISTRGKQIQDLLRDNEDSEQKNRKLNETIATQDQRIQQLREDFEQQIRKLQQQKRELNEAIVTKDQQIQQLRDERWEPTNANEGIADNNEQSSGNDSIATDEGPEYVDNQGSGQSSTAPTEDLTDNANSE